LRCGAQDRGEDLLRVGWRYRLEKNLSASVLDLGIYVEALPVDGNLHGFQVSTDGFGIEIEPIRVKLSIP